MNVVIPRPGPNGELGPGVGKVSTRIFISHISLTKAASWSSNTGSESRSKALVITVLILDEYRYFN